MNTKRKAQGTLKTKLLKKVKQELFLTKEELHGNTFYVLNGREKAIMSTDVTVMKKVLRESRLDAARNIFKKSPAIKLKY